jgi:NADPH:quinone reductase-like Zn-dependent oxidoreductase
VLGDPRFILGGDISGVIEEVVPGVNGFHVGDAVFGIPLFPRPANAYAEFVAIGNGTSAEPCFFGELLL